MVLDLSCLIRAAKAISGATNSYQRYGLYSRILIEIIFFFLMVKFFFPVVVVLEKEKITKAARMYLGFFFIQFLILWSLYLRTPTKYRDPMFWYKSGLHFVWVLILVCTAKKYKKHVQKLEDTDVIKAVN